jgi:hypothetical protein
VDLDLASWTNPCSRNMEMASMGLLQASLAQKQQLEWQLEEALGPKVAIVDEQQQVEVVQELLLQELLGW